MNNNYDNNDNDDKPVAVPSPEEYGKKFSEDNVIRYDINRISKMIEDVKLSKEILEETLDCMRTIKDKTNQKHLQLFLAQEDLPKILEETLNVLDTEQSQLEQKSNELSLSKNKLEVSLSKKELELSSKNDLGPQPLSDGSDVLSDGLLMPNIVEDYIDFLNENLSDDDSVGGGRESIRLKKKPKTKKERKPKKTKNSKKIRKKPKRKTKANKRRKRTRTRRR